MIVRIAAIQKIFEDVLWQMQLAQRDLVRLGELVAKRS
jgi:hypothetical protein